MSDADLMARELAQKALALIEQHQAVCIEAEKRRTQQFNDMRSSMEGWLSRIQSGYDTNWSDIGIRHSNAIKAVADGCNIAVSNVSGALNAFMMAQADVNKSFQDKWFWLIITYAGAVSAGFVALLSILTMQVFKLHI